MIDGIATPTQPAGRSVRQRLARLRLRFRDPVLESAFREDRLDHNLGNVRFGFIAGIGLWIGWGLLLRPYMLSIRDLQLDTQFRFGVFIPLLVLGYAFTYTRLFRRVWEWTSFAIVVATLVVWVFYSTKILTLPAEYGYVGVILITAFTYTLLRLRFFLVVLTTLAGIAVYLPYVLTAKYIAPVSSVLAALYLISFGVLGSLAAYWMERFARQLFLRQRDLDQERTRSDGLLLNILPQAVVEQLKNSSGERIAEAFDDVSVIFVDAVGSTQQAARSSPRRSPTPSTSSSVGSISSPTGTVSRRSRRSATRTWPSRARRSRWRTMPTPPSGWRSRSSPDPGWCGGRRETRSWCGVGSRRDRSSPV